MADNSPSLCYSQFCLYLHSKYNSVYCVSEPADYVFASVMRSWPVWVEITGWFPLSICVLAHCIVSGLELWLSQL